MVGFLGERQANLAERRPGREEGGCEERPPAAASAARCGGGGWEPLERRLGVAS